MEYILVFIISLTILSFFFPIGFHLKNAAIFSIELRSAKTFMSDLESSLHTLNILAEGSSFQVKVNILSIWSLSVQRQKIILSFPKNENEFHTISINSPITISDFSHDFSKQINLRILKGNKKASISIIS